MKPVLAPSVMCMDSLSLRQEIETLNGRADRYHFDLMDGHFVPNLALSADLAAAVASVSRIPLDFHLMVEHPERYLEPCRAAVASLTEKGIISYFSPHCETLNGTAFRLISKIREAGFKPGVAVNPETPPEVILPYLSRIETVTFMCVDPGFNSQPFIPETIEKIRRIREIRDAEPEKYHFSIQADGGCGVKTFGALAEAGVDSFVLGTAGLFRQGIGREEAFEQVLRLFEALPAERGTGEGQK